MKASKSSNISLMPKQTKQSKNMDNVPTTLPKIPGIYEAIQGLLVERGWKIEPTAKEDRYGATMEFIHPETGRAMAWIDAILAESDREC